MLSMTLYPPPAWINSTVMGKKYPNTLPDANFPPQFPGLHPIPVLVMLPLSAARADHP
jgi:hypothetical protein